MNLHNSNVQTIQGKNDQLKSLYKLLEDVQFTMEATILGNNSTFNPINIKDAPSYNGEFCNKDIKSTPKDNLRQSQQTTNTMKSDPTHVHHNVNIEELDKFITDNEISAIEKFIESEISKVILSENDPPKSEFNDNLAGKHLVV